MKILELILILIVLLGNGCMSYRMMCDVYYDKLDNKIVVCIYGFVSYFAIGLVIGELISRIF